MGNFNKPGPAPVPDHRINEIMEEMRKLRDQNSQLRGHIDMMAQQIRQPQQAPQQEAQSDFDPRVDQALEKKINAVARKLLEPVSQKVDQTFNYYGERNDLIEFQQRWGVKDYDKYKDKIENLRQEKRSQGQWLSREDAYKYVRFEEEQRKPQQKPEPGQSNQPVFDPYLQKWSTPEGAQPQAEGQNTLPPEIPQTPGTQNLQAPTNQAPQAPAPTQTEDFGLAPDSFNAGFKGAPAGQAPIDLAADDKALDAWAQKYGDQPL